MKIWRSAEFWCRGGSLEVAIWEDEKDRLYFDLHYSNTSRPERTFMTCDGPWSQNLWLNWEPTESSRSSVPADRACDDVGPRKGDGQYRRIGPILNQRGLREYRLRLLRRPRHLRDSAIAIPESLLLFRASDSYAPFTPIFRAKKS